MLGVSVVAMVLLIAPLDGAQLSRRGRLHPGLDAGQRRVRHLQ